MAPVAPERPVVTPSPKPKAAAKRMVLRLTAAQQPDQDPQSGDGDANQEDEERENQGGEQNQEPQDQEESQDEEEQDQQPESGQQPEPGEMTEEEAERLLQGVQEDPDEINRRQPPLRGRRGAAWIGWGPSAWRSSRRVWAHPSTWPLSMSLHCNSRLTLR